MKDMFFNYDNNINTDTPPMVPICDIPEKHLESNPNLSLVKDLKGNDIGICARYGAGFDLYFTLTGCVENSPIEELIANSIINFKIIDYWNKVIIEKDFTADEAYYGDNTIQISIPSELASTLRQETYYMVLTLTWNGGSYILYNKDNGFLTIK